jgi:hypothetical protein
MTASDDSAAPPASRRTPRLVLAAALLACALGTSRGAAAAGSDADRLLAQSLFDQAKRLMDAGRYGEACPKLAESQRLDPAGGTLLNLALCHEEEGHLATAWADFKEALGEARRAGRPDRERAARAHIAALEPHLARLTLEVRQPDPRLTVKIDGALVGGAAWNTATPVDPGWHEIVAEAPEKKKCSQRIEIQPRQQTTLIIPPLEDEPPGAGAPAQVDATSAAPTSAVQGSDRPATPTWSLRKTAYVVGAAGVVALGIGSYFGIQAFSKNHASDAACPDPSDGCPKNSIRFDDEAKTAAFRSDLAFGAGLVGLGVATYLYLKSPSSGADATAHVLRLDPLIAADGGGLYVSGFW